MTVELDPIASHPASRASRLSSPAAGSTALVTGALSRDGATLARELAAAGHHLTLVADREDGLHELAAELGATGVTVTTVCPRLCRT